MLDIVFENKRVIRNLESLAGLCYMNKYNDFSVEYLVNASDDDWLGIHRDIMPNINDLISTSQLNYQKFDRIILNFTLII